MTSKLLNILLVVALAANVVLIAREVQGRSTEQEYATLTEILENLTKQPPTPVRDPRQAEPVGLLRTALKLFGVAPRGVIHVGAHVGQEQQRYHFLGISNVLWVEADPALYQRLIQNVHPDNLHIFASNFAASDTNGIADFMITNNDGLSSSLLELGEHKKLHPSVQKEKTIQVQTQRLDTFFQQNPILENFNIMVLDVQGAELLVFKGAVETLAKLDCIIAEISYVELYETSPTIDKLDGFLFEHGFVRADTISQTRGWGDALYIKKQ